MIREYSQFLIGYTAFYPEWDKISFVTCYIGFVPMIVWYVGYKLIRRSKVVPLLEVDFETGRVTRYDVEKDNEEDVESNGPWYKKLLSFIA